MRDLEKQKAIRADYLILLHPVVVTFTIELRTKTELQTRFIHA